ncbi:MAG: glycogen synthase GlgA [Cypionkella sp.]|nr:glycogen synthase GlgA [Cypionkella sp.]
MGGKVLSVASESVPLVKTGGLADVVGALPAALAPLGWQVRTILPAYRALRPHLAQMSVALSLPDLFGGPARVMAGQVAGLDLLLLDAPHLYDRTGGPYSDDKGDFPDNPQRFAALSWVAAQIARDGMAGWKPDVLHGHDWQAGFAPAYLRYHGSGGAASVITIHNIAFQGWADVALMDDLQLPRAAFTPDALEYYGGLSSLKAALVTADAITTVSPTYAGEIMRPEFGMGLEGVIAARASDVLGILNGVDGAVWSPQIEPIPYAAQNMAGKAKNRAALLADLNLKVDGPLAILVSRLTAQKGIDLALEVLPEFLDAGGGLAVLGTGDPAFELGLRALASRYPAQVSVKIGYDEGYSHRLFAGGDMVLVPSRFEPCGLTQMYGLAYGTLPVVAGVGGLADTVIHASPAALAAGAATGVVFSPVDALGFAGALRRARALFDQRDTWAKMQRTMMGADFGWAGPAREYCDLYQRLIV